MTRFAPLAMALLAGACATAPAVKPAPAAPARTNPAPPPPQTGQAAPSGNGFIAPKIMNLPGVEGLIGSDAAGLRRAFGEPRLDVREGDARKLQFAGQACVLDVFLYPLRPGAEPTATYVEARRASDAFEVDRVACISSLKR